MTQEPSITDRQVMLRTFLLEQWDLFGDQVDRYQWPRETERWKEFIFCTLFRAGQPHLKAASARQLVWRLDEFGMLDLATLASHADASGNPDFTHTDLTVIKQLLEQQGVTPERAQAAVATLCRAAFALRERYGGKVQLCLRQLGEQMVETLSEQLRLTELPREDCRQILIHWIQNTCNMPVPLRDSAMQQWCKEMNVSEQEVVEVADELDINAALVDDIFDCLPDFVPELEEALPET